MPKSKRNKIVHLTQVRKKGKDHKEDLIKQLEQNVAKFKRVFLFDFDQTKADRIMALRVKLKDQGRIFSGKNSLVSVTLKTIGENTRTDFEDLIKHVTGHRGLLFTDLQCNKLIQVLDDEMPEFRKKLKGYAELAPEVVQMEMDAGDENAESNGKKAKGKKPTKRTTPKRKTKKGQQDDEDEVDKVAGDDDEDDGNSGDKREVKFVKI